MQVDPDGGLPGKALKLKCVLNVRPFRGGPLIQGDNLYCQSCTLDGLNLWSWHFDWNYRNTSSLGPGCIFDDAVTVGRQTWRKGHRGVGCPFSIKRNLILLKWGSLNRNSFIRDKKEDKLFYKSNN